MRRFARGVLALTCAVVLALALTLCFGCDKQVSEPSKEKQLVNKNATAEARRLYDYIWSVSGSKVLSGQQESTWMDGGNCEYEMEYLESTTGKLPAIRGFDFIEDDFDGVVERAKAWAKRGGIVSICWHCSKDLDGGYEDSKVAMPKAEWDAILTAGTPENIAFLNNLDKAGRALKLLQDEGIPVVWRPFHECDGWWFWWSLEGGEYFKRLWIMTYDHFTNDLHLDNLIWMLGFSHAEDISEGRMEEYFPGLDYCDIVGADSYNVRFNGAEPDLYKAAYALVGDKKPLAMHECGLIPTEEQFAEAPWTYFLTWHTEYLTDKNEKDALRALYSSDYVVTLDELPNFYA